MANQKVKIEGGEVGVGDAVGFKCDIEQVGGIVAIKRGPYDRVTLIVENSDGFDGEYIGGETRTEIDAREAWKL